MKKFVILSFLFLGFIYSSSGQFKEEVNVSLFAGGYFAQQNTNNQGGWYGIYAEYLPFKTSDHVSFGFSFLYSKSRFENNTQTYRYEGSSSQIGAGITVGKYWDFFSLRHSAFLGTNIMLKKTEDQGRGDGHNGSVYEMTQEDYIVSFDLNFNLLKTYGYSHNIFPRTQFKLGWQKPLAFYKEDYWNGDEIPESVIWDKAGFSSEIKLSLIEAGLFENLRQYKVFLGYQYFRGDRSHWLITGPEMSFLKMEKDDWLSINLFVKQRIGNFEPSLNDTHFGVNLVFTFTNL